MEGEGDRGKRGGERERERKERKKERQRKKDREKREKMENREKRENTCPGFLVLSSRRWCCSTSTQLRGAPTGSSGDRSLDQSRSGSGSRSRGTS